ncbi:MAG: 1,4-alpha-glucan branching protein GlgB [Pseudomonadota bacterium]
MSQLTASQIQCLLDATLVDPFAVLGCHAEGSVARITTFQPGADAVRMLSLNGHHIATLAQVHPAGLFTGEDRLSRIPPRYIYEVTHGERVERVEDPYHFPSCISDHDAWLFSEGTLAHAWQMLGAHAREVNGVAGVHFATWAPNARRVAVLGDFNAYDNRTHGMRFHPGSGIWEMFVPGPGINCHYRFEVMTAGGRRLQKADPYARALITPADTVARVTDNRFDWSDAHWIAARRAADPRTSPVAVYEVHAGSWDRQPDGEPLDYDTLAGRLLDYVEQQGYTHIQFMPLSEHPFTGSWGYQPIGLFAPTARFGEPEALKRLINSAHNRGIGILLDWVPAHFPKDPHGLAQFDGTALYEHADPRLGEHPDWGTLIFNFGRSEVISYLVSNALYWVEEFHVDGLRVDAVASMLYLDYSRQEGQWLPNRHGGRENLEAVALLQKVNHVIHDRHPGVMMIAEESTAWPGVTSTGGTSALGFTFKWNMGWMHDTLQYMSKDPIHRRHHHHDMTFAMVYAYSERYILPISHDEVVHGKGSLLAKMPGDTWQQYANLRALLAWMWAHPGKKHLFMGCDIAQKTEWNHDGVVDWPETRHPHSAGIQRLVADLNRLLRSRSALFEADNNPQGFQWLVADDAGHSVLAFVRWDLSGHPVVVAANLTPVIRHDYVLAVPAGYDFQEILNTDSRFYGGSDIGNPGRLQSVLGRDGSILRLVLPPLGIIYLEPVA